jgi:hypothetical protein
VAVLVAELVGALVGVLALRRIRKDGGN